MNIGVLTPVQQSQYGNPVFIIPKKEPTVMFIMDYCRINQKLVRKPYPLTRTGDTMHQLKGFYYAATLYLNVGYYTIKISPMIQDTMTIVNEFGIFGYNSLPMCMCYLGDTSQAKIDNMNGETKGIKTYIDDVLVLRKEIFSKHIEQLRIIFGRLRAAGLKVNAFK